MDQNLTILIMFIIYHQSVQFSNLQTPLHNAAIVGSTEIYHYLIEQGADVNAKDKFHYSSINSGFT